MAVEPSYIAQSTNGNKAFVIVFGLQRETKNTHRYSELSPDDGTLYAAAEIGVVRR